MSSLSKMVILSIVAITCYGIVNGVKAQDVIVAMADVTEQAQDLVGEITIEGDSEFESIDEPTDVSNEVVSSPNTNAARLFALSERTSTDSPAAAPARVARPAAQTGTETVDETPQAPETTTAPTTAAPTTTTTTTEAP